LLKPHKNGAEDTPNYFAPIVTLLKPKNPFKKGSSYKKSKEEL
jgi:hypothetical protein